MNRSFAICIVLISAALTLSKPAHAWGDEGHEIVGLVADHYLTPKTKQALNALLATDNTHLTPDTGIASEATWADKYRDSDRNTTKVHYSQTHNWHFVDIELSDASNIDKPCNNHPVLPAGTPASEGEPKDCVIDKINQFIAELKSTSTTPDERRQALQFLLHFVGDLHQPLHASDDNDSGGNQKNVKATKIAKGNLHHYWDVEFVKRLGKDPNQVANSLITGITQAKVASWSKGTPTNWAKESFKDGKTTAYGKLPTPGADGVYQLPDSYVTSATNVVANRLSRAGVRLAYLLNSSLGQ